jgi:putative membrane protein
LQAWSFPRLLTLCLALATCFYARGCFRLRKTSPHLIGIRQIGAFLGGLTVVWIAVGSPLAALDHQLLLVHMVEHILLMAVAVPLIYLGEPGRAFSSAMPEGLVPRRIGAFLRRAPLRWVGRIASHPFSYWFPATITVIGWHVPALFELGMYSSRWHEFQSASFFLAGLLFWWPVIEPWPSVPKCSRLSLPLYLFLATLPCDLLSASLTFSDHVVYSTYRFPQHARHVSPLQDQQWAGVIMWVAVTFLYLAPAVAVTVRTLSPAKARSFGLTEAFQPAPEPSFEATDKEVIQDDCRTPCKLGVISNAEATGPQRVG